MRPPSRLFAFARTGAFVLVALAIVYAWQRYRGATEWHVGFPPYIGVLLPLYANDSPINLEKVARRDALTIAIATGVVAILGVAWCVARRYSTASCLLVALVGVWTTNVAVGYLRGDHALFVEPFSRRGLEYHTDVPWVRDDPLKFIADYPELVAMRRLSHHAGTHPPGGVLFLWAGEKWLGPPPPPPTRDPSTLTPRQQRNRMLLRLMGGSDGPPVDRTLDTAVWLAVTFTSLGVLPAFCLAHVAGGAAAARRMLPLYVAAPSLILFGATSMDGVFLVFNLVALAAGVAAVRRRSFVWPVVAGVALWAAAFMTFAAIAVPVLLVSLTLIDAARWIFRRRDRGFEVVPRGESTEDAWRALVLRRRAQPVVEPPRPIREIVLSIVRCAAVGVVFVICQLIAQRTIGYDLRAHVESAMRVDMRGLGITGYETRELWACISLCNGFALIVGSGACASALAVIGLVRWPPLRLPIVRFGLATFATIALLATSTLFTLETERVWLCLTPAVAIAATAAYRGGMIWIAAPLGMLAQAIWVEVNFRTWW